jgi:hypothetical protein
LRDGIGDQELELACFVSTGGEGGLIVALHIDRGPAEVSGEPLEFFNRGRKESERDTRRKFHAAEIGSEKLKLRHDFAADLRVARPSFERRRCCSF